MESDLHILFADVSFYLFVILASASPTSNINTESTLTFTLVSNIQTFTPILQDEMLLCHLPEKQNKIFEISGSSENYTIFVNTTRIGSKSSIDKKWKGIYLRAENRLFENSSLISLIIFRFYRREFK